MKYPSQRKSGSQNRVALLIRRIAMTKLKVAVSGLALGMAIGSMAPTVAAGPIAMASSIFGRGAGYDSAHRHERCTKAHANGRAHAAAFSATRARRRPHRSARARRQRFQRSALSGRSSARRKVGFSSSSHTANGSAGLGVPSRCRSKPSASWVGSWRRSTCRLANMQPRRPGRERTQLPCLTIQPSAWRSPVVEDAIA